MPLATATGSEKARSELIISPILVEVRKILQQQVSLFSGEDFTVEPELVLSGIGDFLISGSPEQIGYSNMILSRDSLRTITNN